jgi:plasmid replication initiation protein
MNNQILKQDNRITTARYELSAVEKRIMYILISKIRNKFVLNDDGQRDLFNDLVIQTTSSELVSTLQETNTKRVKQALKSLRLRSFEWDNGLPEDDPNHEWFEVGFINYGDWKRNGIIEFQVSKKILPFFIELTEKFTQYSLIVAISLKSKWSQRFYELLCRWRQSGGFQLPISDLRKQFALEDKYTEYASLRSRVIDVAHKEIKKLYKDGKCDIYFEYSELKQGRSVETLKIKVISRVDENQLKDIDLDYLVRTDLYSIFKTKEKPKNKKFVEEVMQVLRLDPDKLRHCYNKLENTIKKLPREEQSRLLRYIIKEDYLTNKPLPKRKQLAGAPDGKVENPGAMATLFDLADKKNSNG